MSEGPAVLGIDLGTSQVKALLCGRDGRVLGQGVAGYPLRTPEIGWAETSTEEWWRATGAAVRAALEGAGDAGAGAGAADILGLAVVGQMHGLVLSDAGGTALRPAVVWLDQRAGAETEDYLGLPPPLRSALGNRPSPGMAGPVAAWLARHEPRVFGRARWLLQPKDWLRLRLTGEAASEPTDASGTLLFDLTRRQWSAAAAGAMGLDTSLLPPLRSPADIGGKLRAEAAAHLGLPAGLPVAVGAADTAASLLAAALPGPGWGLLTLGTGGQWVVPVAGPGPRPGQATAGQGAAQPDPSGQTNLFAAVDGGTYRLAAAQNVGAALGWVISALSATWEDLYGTAACGWRPGTPLFQPRLAAERWDAAGAGGGNWAGGGGWSGVSLAHGRADLLRAALEGVAFLLRARLEDLRRAGGRPDRAVIAGGGGRDASWRQLLADVFQLPVLAAGSPWLTVRGATLIAGVAAGLYADWDEAARSVPPPEPAADPGPNAPAEEHYRRWYASFAAG